MTATDEIFKELEAVARQFREVANQFAEVISRIEALESATPEQQ